MKYICEVHWGVYEGPLREFCNNGGDITCGAVKYIPMQPSKYAGGAIIPELELFVEQWDSGAENFLREDVESLRNMVVSFLSGNFFIEEAQSGRESRGHGAGKRGRQERTDRDTGRPSP